MAKKLPQQPAANPGVRYRVLRQMAQAGQTASASITVEFTPNDNGILTVMSDGRTLFSQPVTRLETYTTEPVSAGDGELTVVFSRTVPVTVTGAVSLGALNNVSGFRRSEDADGTYVVGEPASAELRFTINLNGK